jgi:UDP-glucuronate 4-epimerase
MTMKVLVTGGAGFIGSHLVDSLLEGGNSVVVVDNFDPFYDRKIKEANIKKHLQAESYKLIEANICDRDLILKLFDEFRPEVVVHLAAKAGVRPSIENPLHYVEVNINGTVNVLDAAVQYGVQKFIFASSSSVYGLNKEVPFTECDPILEQASPYGATKASGEALCRSYSNCYNLPIVALRFFTVYGPRQRPDLAIHKFTKKILNNEPLPLFGDGSTSRDYTYIDDIINGIRASIEYCKKGYEVFNLGNDNPTCLLDLVNALEEVLEREARIEWLPEQVGDVPQTWASIVKSRRLLNYSPNISISKGLNYFVKWTSENFQEK